MSFYDLYITLPGYIDQAGQAGPSSSKDRKKDSRVKTSKEEGVRGVGFHAHSYRILRSLGLYTLKPGVLMEWILHSKPTTIKSVENI